MVDNQCKLEYCDKPVLYKKHMLCRGHYMQKCRGATFSPLNYFTKNVGKCVVDGCSRDSKSRGMCMAHYARKWRSQPNKPKHITKQKATPMPAHKLFAMWYRQVFTGG